MPGRVSCQSGPDCRYKFTGKERDSETNYDYFGARYYDPKIGRFLSVDPMTHMRASLTPYNYVQNNPLRRIDHKGMLDEEDDKKKRAAQSAAISEGQRANQAANARQEYNKNTSKLDPNDSSGRTAAKEAARAKTPQPYKAMAESKHSMANEATKVGGTANKTNAGVNQAMNITGKVGKGLLVVGAATSVYNVATAENTTKAVVQEAGTWAVAIAGGKVGASAGAAIGGGVGALFAGVGAAPGAVVGGIVGGLIGGITGGIIGNEVTTEAYEYFEEE